jgi:hypothetical protein
MHWNHSERCRLVALSMAQATGVVQSNESKNYALTENSTSNNKLIDNMLDNMEVNDNVFDNNVCGSFSEFNDGNNTEDDVGSVTNPNENTEQDLEIMMKYLTFKDSKEDVVATPMAEYKTYVDLLHILKTCNTPLYMFDKIMEWANKSRWVHKFDFLPTQISARDKFVGSLKRQFDYNCLEPTTCDILLPGSNSNVNLVLHDFKDCFYSLLSDPQLMDENNLLINPDDIFGSPPKKSKHNMISDVNTGDVWRMAYKQYVQSDQSELLCPIIFFIDKTHTDLVGRLCIEQIRFTLGIFKLHVRNQSSAWRTLGYILDQNQICTLTSENKMQDYQAMTSRILKSLKDAQSAGIGWNLVLKKTTVRVFFRVPILFIIGDTDGHDKLVGKFGNRTNKVKRICRYCDCPYDSTDDPFYIYKLNKKKEIIQLIKDNKREDLRAMSFHCVPNAWSELQFCDNMHGIYGATPAELMHCLQKGLYEYIVNALFSQKQIKKTKSVKRKGKEIRQQNLKRNRELKEIDRNGDVDSDLELENDVEEERLVDNTTIPGESIVLSRYNVFSKTYGKKFDNLTRRYGKHLMHQSNRELPRTHFYTNYTSTGYKNASELSGMLIVFLMVFSTKEGEQILDKSLGDQRTSNYIHLFELMLMLENFCKTEEHLHANIQIFKKMLPSIMENYKNTVDRKEGNQMKIIKYHLPLHFADDMFRFGSMANYDSSIGELHHKDFAKKPSKTTQRRKEIFEIQTAKCQINNLAIDRAFDYVYPGTRYGKNVPDSTTKPMMNKNNILEFCGKINNIVYTNGSKKNRPICNWLDTIFLKQLFSESLKAIENGDLAAPIKFFTQHNRNGTIFRADPQFHKITKQPWYDWVKVDWGNQNEDACPAKLLLFMEVSDSDFIKTFKFGNSYIESSGSYALAYSLAENVEEPAHLDSRLVTYGKILSENEQPILYVFDVNSITDTCVAVPYHPKDTVITANEWLFFKSKDEWYNLFVDFMKEKLNEP